MADAPGRGSGSKARLGNAPDLPGYKPCARANALRLTAPSAILLDIMDKPAHKPWLRTENLLWQELSYSFGPEQVDWKMPKKEKKDTVFSAKRLEGRAQPTTFVP